MRSLNPDPFFHPTLEEAIETFIKEMEIESLDAPLTDGYAFFAHDEPNGWCVYSLVIGSAPNLLDRVLWGVGSLAAVLKAQAVAIVGSRGSKAKGDEYSSVEIERRGAAELEVINFGPRLGAGEGYFEEGSHFVFLPGGRDDDGWGYRNHAAMLEGFGDDDVPGRPVRDVWAQLSRFGSETQAAVLPPGMADEFESLAGHGFDRAQVERIAREMRCRPTAWRIIEQLGRADSPNVDPELRAAVVGWCAAIAQIVTYPGVTWDAIDAAFDGEWEPDAHACTLWQSAVELKLADAEGPLADRYAWGWLSAVRAWHGFEYAPEEVDARVRQLQQPANASAS